MARKAVSYIRVSSEEQTHGYSIPAQRQVLADYVKGHDLEIVEEFVESESAYKPGRPEFTRMLQYLRRHKDVTGVLCYKIDRIARNMRDYAQLEEMDRVAILSATEALPENATGKLVGTVLAASSRYFSDQLSERVKLALETKARSGKWPTLAPLGYANDPIIRGIVPDPQRARLIQEVFEIYASGEMPLSKLVQWTRRRGLRTRGGRYLAKSTLHKLLTNPVYYGAVRWQGIVHDGVHEPLITKALFDKVQDQLQARNRPMTRRSFPFRGLLECGYCGCKITAGLIKRKYVYYFCTQGRGRCTQPYVREEDLGERLVEVVDNVHLTQEQVEMLLEMMRREKLRRQHEWARKLLDLEQEEGLITRRRDAAYVDKLDGKISEQRWRELEREWSSQTDTIQDNMERLKEYRGPSLDDAQATFELLERAPDLYLKQSDQERARLLKTLVLNIRLSSETLEPVYKKPSDLVVEGVKTSNWYALEDLNHSFRLIPSNSS